MILHETYIDGVNNETELLKQRNHNAVQMLKIKWKRFLGTTSSENCTVFDSGRIINVGPGVELAFDSFAGPTHAVIYGDIDKINGWIRKAIEALKNHPLYK